MKPLPGPLGIGVLILTSVSDDFLLLLRLLVELIDRDGLDCRDVSSDR